LVVNYNGLIVPEFLLSSLRPYWWYQRWFFAGRWLWWNTLLSCNC